MYVKINVLHVAYWVAEAYLCLTLEMVVAISHSIVASDKWLTLALRPTMCVSASLSTVLQSSTPGPTPVSCLLIIRCEFKSQCAYAPSWRCPSSAWSAWTRRTQWLFPLRCDRLPLSTRCSSVHACSLFFILHPTNHRSPYTFEKIETLRKYAQWWATAKHLAVSNTKCKFK